MKIAIVGYGFVGTATEYLFKTTDATVLIHDPYKDMIIGEYSDTMEASSIPLFLDYIFLCVPTNLIPETGKLDTTILEQVYDEWKDYGKIVIRSTIGPDQVDLFPDAIMMPEFLREAHWKEDVDSMFLPIIVSDVDFCNVLKDLFSMKSLRYKEIKHLGAKEAMMFKLARNATLAMRVALANHFHGICENYNMDYSDVQIALEDDTIVGGSHWQVPGPDGKEGFGGKCLPKDLTHVSNLCYNEDNIMKKALADNLIWRV